MFNQRSDLKEQLDDLLLNDIELIQNLHEIEFTNRWFGSRHTLICALDYIYKNIKTMTTPVKITDLGCGSGDLLRDVVQWSRARKINTQLLGIDGNQLITRHARSLSKHHNIEFQKMNVFSPEFRQLEFDIVTLNSFCHHLSDNQLIALLKQLQRQTRIAIIINDLQRHWIPFYGIKLVCFLLHFSRLSKHDGPTSVLRAFTKKDLTSLMQAINIDRFTIRWRWAFRWQLIIWSNKNNIRK